MLVSFLMFWQLGELLVAQMIVERSTSAAGRAAVVLLPDDPAFYNGEARDVYDGQRKREIRLAAGMMLAASPHLSENFTVAVDDIPAGDDRTQDVDVRVDAEFRCKTLRWVCGMDGVLVLSAEAPATYQAASYEYEPFDPTQLAQGDMVNTSEPGCTDGDGKGPGGKNGGGNGGKSCPPGETALKDGTCSKSKGGNEKCKNGAPAAPDGLCEDGTCPGTNKKPNPTDSAEIKDTDAEIKSDCGQIPKAKGSALSRLKAKLDKLFKKRKKEETSVCNAPPEPQCAPDGDKPDCNDPTKNGGGRQSLPNSCGKCRFVYRRDTRPPSEIFKSGFTSKGSTYDLSDFIVGIDTKSGFISTTSNENTALQLSWQNNDQLSWKNNGAPQPNTDYIYKIRDCGSGVDVNATLDADSCSDSAVADKLRRYQYQNEIAVPGKIDADDIVSVIQPRDSDRPPAPPQPQGGQTLHSRAARGVHALATAERY